MGDRIIGKAVPISGTGVAAFFKNRAARFDQEKPLVSVIYQDSNPELAVMRDKAEREKLSKLLPWREITSVLDLGCGIGRLAAMFAGRDLSYHGVDFMPEFIKIAQDNHGHLPGFSFQTGSVKDLSVNNLPPGRRYDFIIFAGILMYLDDDEVMQVLNRLADVCAPGARILVREPSANSTRLTLDNIWSEELKHHYSSIYRTVPEQLEMLRAALGPVTVEFDEPMFEAQLNVRRETHLHLLLCKLAERRDAVTPLLNPHA